MRLALGLLCWLSFRRFNSAVASRFGDSPAGCAAAVWALQFHLPFYLSRTLPNVFALCVILLALEVRSWWWSSSSSLSIWCLFFSLVFLCCICLCMNVLLHVSCVCIYVFMYVYMYVCVCFCFFTSNKFSANITHRYSFGAYSAVCYCLVYVYTTKQRLLL